MYLRWLSQSLNRIVFWDDIGLQYNQWRIAGDIPVNRYKTLRGADAFKLLLRPAFFIFHI